MANKILKTYSFLNVAGAFAGPTGAFPLASDAGIAEEGITIEWNGDVDTMTIGANGDGMHSLHADKSGSVTVRILKTSPLNGLLDAACALQTSDASLHGQNLISFADARGESVTCEGSAFSHRRSVTFAKEGGMNEYKFNSIKMTVVAPVS